MGNSKLAAIALDSATEQSVVDTLWLEADLKAVKDPATAPSDKVAKELLSGDDEQVSLFASLTPNRKFLTEHDSDAFLKGAITNPHAPSSVFEKAAEKDIPKAKKSLKRSKKFINADEDTNLNALAVKLNSRNVVGPVVEAVIAGSGNVVRSLARLTVSTRASEPDAEGRQYVITDDGVTYRNRVLESLRVVDEDIYGRTIGQLLNFNTEDSPTTTRVVDGYLANWICESESVYAISIRSLFFPDTGLKNSTNAPRFVAALTGTGRERLRVDENHNLWELVARKKIIHDKLDYIPEAMDYNRLYQMKMLDIELTGPFFSTNFPVTPEQLVRLLDGVNPSALVNLLTAQTRRFLQEGQTTALLDMVGPAGRERIFKLINALEPRTKVTAEPSELETDETPDVNDEPTISLGIYGMGVPIVNNDDEPDIHDLFGDGEPEQPVAFDLTGIPWYPELVAGLPQLDGNIPTDSKKVRQYLAKRMHEALADDTAAWSRLIDSEKDITTKSFNDLLNEATEAE